MATLLKTPPRPASSRLEVEQLFLWLEDALVDPIVDTNEFLAAIRRLAEILEETASSSRLPDGNALAA